MKLCFSKSNFPIDSAGGEILQEMRDAMLDEAIGKELVEGERGGGDSLCRG